MSREVLELPDVGAVSSETSELYLTEAKAMVQEIFISTLD